MQTFSVNTFTAQIYVGLREGYTDRINSIELVKAICRDYVSKVGLCVTVTATEFIYTPSKECTHSGEPGAIIGLINYPRFPTNPDYISSKAIDIATILLTELKQNRISIVDSEQTIMLLG